MKCPTPCAKCGLVTGLASLTFYVNCGCDPSGTCTHGLCKRCAGKSKWPHCRRCGTTLGRAGVCRRCLASRMQRCGVGSSPIAPARINPPKTVFEAIATWGHDEDFSPSTDGFEPTDAPPGSAEKMAVIMDRLNRGLPLHHPRDRYDLEGLQPQHAGEIAAKTPRGTTHG